MVDLIKKTDAREVLDIDRETWAEIKDELIDLMETNDDFIFDIDDAGYRFIDTNVIEKTFHEECRETIEDCYNLSVPDFIEIDWKATTDNCLVDGYGHQFAHYDANEHEISNNGKVAYHAFRIY